MMNGLNYCISSLLDMIRGILQKVLGYDSIEHVIMNQESKAENRIDLISQNPDYFLKPMSKDKFDVYDNVYWIMAVVAMPVVLL